MPKAAKSSKKGLYHCSACGRDKLPTLFPAKGAELCTECSLKQPEPEKPAQPAPKTAPKPVPKSEKLRIVLPAEGLEPLPEEPPNVFPQVELDPNNPTHQELAARTLARRRLLHFIRRFRPKYLPGWVHEDICRRLERFVRQVEQGLEPRLLLMMPVRHGKSEISSRHFAPWVLGQHPDWEMIAASGAQSLAMSFSRYIRDLVRDPGYQALFPTMKLDPSSQSVENWNTTAGGGYLAAGIGTMITGRGAHILLIDDPVKDAEAADSVVIRDATWEWYMSTALTRLAPGGGVLGIMTWWHEDDWAGRIQQVMATGEGDKFEIVKYPAINELGDEYILPDDTIVEIAPGIQPPEGARLTRPHMTALHPERYTLESLRRRKANYYALGQQRWWAALYQQNPTPDEGAFFTKGMIRRYAGEPSRNNAVIFQAWDFAITEKQKSDWTVGTTLLQDSNDDLFVVDVRRFRTGDGDELMREVVRYAQKWQPQLIGFEDGQIWKALKTTFEKTCLEMQFYPSYEVLVPLTDKMVRAQPLRGRMQAGKIHFPRAGATPWVDEQLAEMLRFPNGKHDDQVDSLAWAVRLTLSKAAPRPPAPPKLPSWRDKLNGMLNGLEGGTHMSA
jgi:predicted phage terminase large subunit-like protein